MSENKTTRQWIHFRAGGRNYACEMAYVREIIRAVVISSVPEWPPFVAGIINLRGEILPVIDFLERGSGGKIALSVSSRIMVMKIKMQTIALLVDEVKEVFQSNEVSSNFSTDTLIETKYISGSVMQNSDTIFIVDMEKLLTDKEFTELKKKVNV